MVTEVTVRTSLFCLDEDTVVAEAVVVADGALAIVESMALDTPFVASSFWMRSVFLESLSPGSSGGWKFLRGI